MPEYILDKDLHVLLEMGWLNLTYLNSKYSIRFPKDRYNEWNSNTYVTKYLCGCYVINAYAYVPNSNCTEHYEAHPHRRFILRINDV